VWAAADPAHDELYAPPESSIDIVVLTMISYPQTEWADPAQKLQAVEARYPDMPVFIEVSVAGQAQEKANWLQQVGNAVADDVYVRAILYHDGSPDAKATLQKHQPWSVISDGLSVDAAKDMITTAALKPLAVEQIQMAR
jgi:hypothetical protein